jgi:hypothetical protein
MEKIAHSYAECSFTLILYTWVYTDMTAIFLAQSMATLETEYIHLKARGIHL